MTQKIEYTKKWERHNAPNGEHIWQEGKHVADISDDGVWSKGANVVAKEVICFHNQAIAINPDNPMAVAENLKEMYDIFRLYGDRAVVATVLSAIEQKE